jgi:hypothetical protein
MTDGSIDRQADADFQRAKAELIKLRIAERRRELMTVADHNRIIDDLAGLLLTRLNSLPAQLAGFDLAARRKAESVILAFRREFATACNKLADERGEPAEPQ